MLCRLTSSKKTPSPWTRRLSSLRGTFWPAKPGLVWPSSTTIGSVTVVVSVKSASPDERGIDRSLQTGAPAEPARPEDAVASAGSLRDLLARGGPDRFDDVPVAGAAADVPLDRLRDLFVGRAGVLSQQRRRAHQHARRAVAALQSVVVAEGLLEGAQLLLFREPLDGLDRRAVRLHREQHAALHERAVEDHAASAAVAGIAADMGASQVEVVADQVHEQAPRLDLPLVGRPVDPDGDRLRRLDGAVCPVAFHYSLARFDACSTARIATTSARWRRYSADAWTTPGGSIPDARTASRTASASPEVGLTSWGTAPTQPSATRISPLAEAAALTMQVPSTPIGTEAKPSLRPAGIVIFVSSSPGPAAVM